VAEAPPQQCEAATDLGSDERPDQVGQAKLVPVLPVGVEGQQHRRPRCLGARRLEAASGDRQEPSGYVGRVLATHGAAHRKPLHGCRPRRIQSFDDAPPRDKLERAAIATDGRHGGSCDADERGRRLGEQLAVEPAAGVPEETLPADARRLAPRPAGQRAQAHAIGEHVVAPERPQPLRPRKDALGSLHERALAPLEC
jgi:hypothetical protein